MTHPDDGIVPGDRRTPDLEIVPDDKDWTWTLERSCPDCGFSAGTVEPADIAGAYELFAEPWQEVLARPDATSRPRRGVWSPLEYGCHVRDVCRLFDERLALMLTEVNPTFSNWDQDETAVADRYAEQQPGQVAAELVASAQRIAAGYERVSGEEWSRPGLRSNGSTFTVLTLGQYGLHDLAHHLWDVGVPLPRRR